MLLILVLLLGLAWFGAMDSITAVTALKANTTINCSANWQKGMPLSLPLLLEEDNDSMIVSLL
jgi:hypothetical protein